MRPATRRKLLDFALTLPGAYEDHPWGEDVAKVNKKVFVFFGIADNPASGMTVKLRDESHEHALSVPGAAPTGYGLGKSGWVTVPYAAPLDVCRDWIEESYRLVAPKRLQAELSSGRRRTRPARIPTRRAAPPG